MVSTKAALNGASQHLYESIGIRETENPPPKLSPVPSARDTERRPAKGFGRIKLDGVIPDPDQPRSEFSGDAIQRLAGSIREKGQLHPIRVRWDNARAKWIIISGERRWRAATEAGLTHIDCYFHETVLSPAEILEQQLIENLLREDLKPIEEARGISSLMTLNGWNGKQVAKALHLSESKVSRSLALLDLPDDIQHQVNDGTVGSRVALEISKLTDDDKKRDLASQVISGKLSHKQAAAAVRQGRGKKAQKPRSTRQVFFADDGWRVTVTCPRKGTYHEMEQALQQALEEVRHYISQGRCVL